VSFNGKLAVLARACLTGKVVRSKQQPRYSTAASLSSVAESCKRQQSFPFVYVRGSQSVCDHVPL